MAKFEITWSTGQKEMVDQSDCGTVEQLINCRFGRGFDVEAHGVKVELAGEEKPPVVKAEPKTPAKSKK